MNDALPPDGLTAARPDETVATGPGGDPGAARVTTGRDGQPGRKTPASLAADPFWSRVFGWPGAAVVGLAAAVVLILLFTGALDGMRADGGTPLYVFAALTLLGVAVAVVRRPLRWWVTWGMWLGIGASAVVEFLAWILTKDQLLVGGYPHRLDWVAWGALWLSAICLTCWRGVRPLGGAIRVLAVPLALLTGACYINTYYGYWPTVGAVLDHAPKGTVSTKTILHDIRKRGTTGVARTTEVAGVLGQVSIPGASVHFEADPAYLWLPPAFFREPRADVPFLLMLPGLPGSAKDWFRSSNALRLAQAYAKAHGGRAPVMLFVNEDGQDESDTECVNGPQGGAMSYLTQVVPDWLEHTLGLRPSPSRWGIAGFSEGGTCALVLSLTHPSMFGRFVDIGGDLAPNWEYNQPPAINLKELWGNNVGAELADTPALLLAEKTYLHTIGWFGTGRQDHYPLYVARRLSVLARASGMRTHLTVVPGIHSWRTASTIYALDYPALMKSLGFR